MVRAIVRDVLAGGLLVRDRGFVNLLQIGCYLGSERRMFRECREVSHCAGKLRIDLLTAEAVDLKPS